MQRGQALIVVLLVLGVAMTVGMAVVSRSVIEVNLSSIQDEGARALSAAEAGIEQSLGGVIVGGGSGIVGTVGDAFVVQSNTSTATTYVVPEELVAGDAATVKLDGGFSGVGKQMRVCWGNGAQPAIELMGYYSNGGVTVVNTVAYDSVSRGNGFATAGVGDGSACPAGFSHSVVVTNSSVVPVGTPMYLRARMLYNGSTPQPVGFAVAAGSWSFPAQGEQITAVGQAGETTQKISVFKGTPDWLPMWDDAVFSGDTLSQ